MIGYTAAFGASRYGSGASRGCRTVATVSDDESDVLAADVGGALVAHCAWPQHASAAHTTVPGAGAQRLQCCAYAVVRESRRRASCTVCCIAGSCLIWQV